MKTLFILPLVLLMSFSMNAQNKNARTVMMVDGICGMCKERIEKAAIKTKGVKSAVWSIESHELSLIFDETKTDTTKIAQNIADVGHDTPNIKASDEAYSSLHGCCKYRDEKVVKDHK